MPRSFILTFLFIKRKKEMILKCGLHWLFSSIDNTENGKWGMGYLKPPTQHDSTWVHHLPFRTNSASILLSHRWRHHRPHSPTENQPPQLHLSHTHFSQSPNSPDFAIWAFPESSPSSLSLPPLPLELTTNHLCLEYWKSYISTPHIHWWSS